MMSLVGLTALCVVALVCSTVAAARLRRVHGPCKCGRRRRVILPPRHLPSRDLWLDAAREAIYVTCIVFIFVGHEGAAAAPFVIVPGLLVVGYFVARAVIHDRDKIRRAAKAAGRVVVHASGRLVVTPATGATT